MKLRRFNSIWDRVDKEFQVKEFEKLPGITKISYVDRGNPYYYMVAYIDYLEELKNKLKNLGYNVGKVDRMDYPNAERMVILDEIRKNSRVANSDIDFDAFDKVVRESLKDTGVELSKLKYKKVSEGVAYAGYESNMGAVIATHFIGAQLPEKFDVEYPNKYYIEGNSADDHIYVCKMQTLGEVLDNPENKRMVNTRTVNTKVTESQKKDYRFKVPILLKAQEELAKAGIKCDLNFTRIDTKYDNDLYVYLDLTNGDKIQVSNTGKIQLREPEPGGFTTTTYNKIDNLISIIKRNFPWALVKGEYEPKNKIPEWYAKENTDIVAEAVPEVYKEFKKSTPVTLTFDSIEVQNKPVNKDIEITQNSSIFNPESTYALRDKIVKSIGLNLDGVFYIYKDFIDDPDIINGILNKEIQKIVFGVIGYVDESKKNKLFAKIKLVICPIGYVDKSKKFHNSNTYIEYVRDLEDFIRIDKPITKISEVGKLVDDLNKKL